MIPDGTKVNSAFLHELDIRFMKEVVEVALLYDAMRMLEMTWGNTNNYRQDVDYRPHMVFLRKCLDVAEEKQKEYENDEDEKYG